MKPLKYERRDYISYLILAVYLVIAIAFRVLGW